MARGPGALQQKILLLLLAGITLSLTRSPHQYFRIVKGFKKEWRKINEQVLKRAIKRLYETKLIAQKLNSDGLITLILTDEGKQKALTYKFEDIKIRKPPKWDKKWRIVLFDIPEKRKQTRDAIRFHLKRMGFNEFQKSVFVCPYACKNEVDYLIEFYNVRRFVRFIVADFIDNELDLKRHFELL